MSFIRLIKRTAKMSANALIFINAFLMIGINNLINPIANPVTAIMKITFAKIVIVGILFKF